MRLYPLSVVVALTACGKGVVDEDGDGYPAIVDCNDGDAAIHPGAAEICDGVDNDCSGVADDNIVDGTKYYADLDGDGAGGDRVSLVACAKPDGYTDSATDCDDLNADAHPGGTEVCDGIDNDCNGVVDDGIDATVTWYTDDDHDGYGDPDKSVDTCTPPLHYVSNNGDCDDAASNVYPGASEVCDGVDNDCDGYTDDADSSFNGFPFYVDADHDGYGSAVVVELCAIKDGYSDQTGDCDDTTAARNPGAQEVCDPADVDENCDGRADDYDPTATGKTPMYVDADRDGYGGTAEVDRCDGGTGWSATNDDCDDSKGTTHPGAVELRNQADDDCNDMCDEGLIQPGDLVISEVMLWGPTMSGYNYQAFGASTNVQWFEVYNNSADDIRLCSGWRLESDGVDESFDVVSPKVIPAGGHFVFGASRDLAVNGGVQVDVSYHGVLNFDECNGNDGIRLWLDANGDGVNDATELIDSVEYYQDPTSYQCPYYYYYAPPVLAAQGGNGPLDWTYEGGSGYAIQLDPRDYDYEANDYMFNQTDGHRAWCSNGGDYHQIRRNWYDTWYWYGTPDGMNYYCQGGGRAR